MTVITVASVKGGVGKTTTSTALASALAQFEKTCLVDFDSQGHVSLYYGLPHLSHVYHWLSGEFAVEDCLVSGRPQGLVLLPGDAMTKALYARFQGSLGAREVADRVRRLTVGAFIVVDTAAGGLLQEAAIVAADQVIIPFRAEKPSIDSLFAMLEIVKKLNPTAQVITLPTGYDRRISQHRMSLVELATLLPDVYGVHESNVIPSRAAVLEAWAAGVTIWEYDDAYDGMKGVRIGYARLLGRVLANAGYDGSNSEVLEAIAHGKK